MEQLALVLGRERVQLEFLLFKLLALQHLLVSGDNRFLRWSAEEINRASQQARTTGALRVQCVNELASAAGIAADQVTLDAVGECAPEPWRTIFADHSVSFRRLVAEVDTAFDATWALADASGHAVADVLERIHLPAHALAGKRSRGVLEPMVLP
jgi:hypothetical protein